MSEQKHTPEPWMVFTPDDYAGPDELPGLGIEADNGDAVVWAAFDAENGLKNDADARRIVACVNSLAGIETAEIEAGVVNEMVKKLRLAKLCIETIGETDGSVEREIDAVLARLGRQS